MLLKRFSRQNCFFIPTAQRQGAFDLLPRDHLSHDQTVDLAHDVVHTWSVGIIYDSRVQRQSRLKLMLVKFLVASWLQSSASHSLDVKITRSFLMCEVEVRGTV